MGCCHCCCCRHSSNVIQIGGETMVIIIDISKYQGDIDFAALGRLYQSGVLKGVIIRVQAGYTSIDPKYKEYVAGCKQYGIPFGTYAYFKGINVPDSIAEAKSCLSLTDPESKFIVVDIEEITAPNLVESGQAFIDYLKNNGVKYVGLYSGEYFYNANGLSALRVDFKWIARYGTNDGQPHTEPAVDDDLWQFTSVGHIEGIAGNVDESIITDPTQFNFFDNPVIAVPTPTPVAIQKSGVVQVVTNNLNLRTGPGTNYPVIRKLGIGEKYQFYFIQDGWYNLGGNQWAYSEGGKYLSESTMTPAPPTPQPVYHKVVKGDTVSELAAHYGSTVNQIKAWNNLANVSLIRIGQNLRVK
jgi:GH25 family lysozyme M1 (1,4-beta-N-acetylmuramidase)/LysM repeat protein